MKRRLPIDSVGTGRRNPKKPTEFDHQGNDQQVELGLQETQTRAAVAAQRHGRRLNHSEETAGDDSALSHLPHGSQMSTEPTNGKSYRSSRGELPIMRFQDSEAAAAASSVSASSQSSPTNQSEAGSNLPGSPMLGARAPLSDGASSRPFRKSLISNLMDLPSESHWEDRVSVKHPKSIVRRARLLCGKVVEAPAVQLTIVTLIVINAILMGVATFDFVTDRPHINRAFETTDRVFLIIFTIELSLQFIYRSLGLFMDGWLVFDFVIVITSWSLESLQIIRAFRVFRAFRLINRVGPLRELIMALGTVMPRMYAIGTLLLLIFYVYAVLFTELFRDLELSENYFGSLDVALFSCMQFMTLEWADTARECMEQRSWAWMPFVSFIAITGFIVFNLIVAVVCDAVSVVDQQSRADKAGNVETDLMKLHHAQERLQELSETVDDMRTRHEKLQRTILLLGTTLQSSSAIRPRLQGKTHPGSLLGPSMSDNDDSPQIGSSSSHSNGEENDGVGNEDDKARSFSEYQALSIQSHTLSETTTDPLMASFTVRSQQSDTNLTQSSTSLSAYISAGSTSLEGAEARTTDALASVQSQRAPLAPKTLSESLLQRGEADSEPSESIGEGWEDSEEAVTMASLAMRGYLTPSSTQRSRPNRASSPATAATEQSSATTVDPNGEATQNQQDGTERKSSSGTTTTKVTAREEMPPMVTLSPSVPPQPSPSRKLLPMKSLFSP
jgi:hypothetical protein